MKFRQIITTQAPTSPKSFITDNQSDKKNAPSESKKQSFVISESTSASQLPSLPMHSPILDNAKIEYMQEMKSKIKNSFMEKLSLYEGKKQIYSYEKDPKVLKAKAHMFKLAPLMTPEVCYEIADTIQQQQLKHLLPNEQNTNCSNKSSNLLQLSSVQKQVLKEMKSDPNRQSSISSTYTLSSCRNSPKPTHSVSKLHSTFHESHFSKLQGQFKYRKAIQELSAWMNSKLKNAPTSEVEALEYKNQIASLGMKEVIRLIKVRCEDEGRLVEQIWDVTWKLCSDIIVHLGNRLRESEKLSTQEVSNLNLLYSDKFKNYMEQEQQQRGVFKAFKKNIEDLEQKNNTYKKEIKDLKLTLEKVAGDNDRFEYEYLRVLEQNLILQASTIDKREWVRKMYKVVKDYKSQVANRMKTGIKKVAERRSIIDGDGIDFENTDFTNLANVETSPFQNQSMFKELETVNTGMQTTIRLFVDNNCQTYIPLTTQGVDAEKIILEEQQAQTNPVQCIQKIQAAGQAGENKVGGDNSGANGKNHKAKCRESILNTGSGGNNNKKGGNNGSGNGGTNQNKKFNSHNQSNSFHSRSEAENNSQNSSHKIIGQEVSTQTDSVQLKFLAGSSHHTHKQSGLDVMENELNRLKSEGQALDQNMESPSGSNSPSLNFIRPNRSGRDTALIEALPKGQLSVRHDPYEAEEARKKETVVQKIEIGESFGNSYTRMKEVLRKDKTRFHNSILRRRSFVNLVDVFRNVEDKPQPIKSYDNWILVQLQKHNYQRLSKMCRHRNDFLNLNELAKTTGTEIQNLSEKKMQAVIEKQLVPIIQEMMRLCRKYQNNLSQLKDYLNSLPSFQTLIKNKFIQRYGFKNIALKNLKQILAFIRVLSARNHQAQILQYLLLGKGTAESADSLVLFLNLMTAVDPYCGVLTGKEQVTLEVPLDLADLQNISAHYLPKNILRQVQSKALTNVSDIAIQLLRNFGLFYNKKISTVSSLYNMLSFGQSCLKLERFVEFICSLNYDSEKELGLLREFVEACDIKYSSSGFGMSLQRLVSLAMRSTFFKIGSIEQDINKHSSGSLEHKNLDELDYEELEIPQYLVKYCKECRVEEDRNYCLKYIKYMIVESNISMTVREVLGPLRYLQGKVLQQALSDPSKADRFKCAES